MSIVEVIQDVAAIRQLDSDWSRLRESCQLQSLSLDQYLNSVSNNQQVLQALVVVVKRDGMVSAILPCAVFLRPRKFVIGELKLFSVRHNVVHVSGAMIGEPDLEQAGMVLDALSQLRDYDSINLYEIATRHNIYKAVIEGKSKLRTSSNLRDVFPHWVVDFPESFDAYMAGFKSKTRSTLKRKLKQFESKHEIVLEKITDPGDVSRFLGVGETISRETYQWDLGTRLQDNAETREKFATMAAQNELICYLMYADGVPMAFTWGQLINAVFHYETPGFLREYSRWSPGTVMLMRVFEDLLDNSGCRCFDFGMGGDFTGYKAQFGNRHYEAALVEFYPCKTLKSRLLYLLDQLFWRLKRMLRLLISPKLKSRVNQALRSIGILK